MLLTEAADEVFVDLLAQYGDNEDAVRRLEEHRTLLTRCRRESIDAAFADRLHPLATSPESELGTLLEELQHPAETSDMSRLVALCQRALTVVSHGRQPEL